MNRLMADISNNNGHVDLTAYRHVGFRIIAIKASEGPAYIDAYHRGNVIRAHSEHLAVVHYHFARPDLDTSPDAEASHFIAATDGLRGPRDYLCLDMERGLGGSFQHDPAWSTEFDKYIQDRTRFHTIIYASRSVLEISDRWLIGDVRRVWDADWSTDRSYAPSGYGVFARQFTDGVFGPGPHAAAGIGRCDMSTVDARVIERIGA